MLALPLLAMILLLTLASMLELDFLRLGRRDHVVAAGLVGAIMATRRPPTA